MARYPWTPKRPNSRYWKKGPTFCAVFMDGTVVAMTTSAEVEEFDYMRGVKLANAAWCNRHKRDDYPLIQKCWFERNRKKVTQIWNLEEAA
jgi:hypothetical protein